MRRLAPVVVLACAVLAFGLLAAQIAKAGPVVKAPVPSTTAVPTGICDEDHILDWEIVNGVMFECACDHMLFGPPVCEWQEILSQADDPQAYRRTIKWIKAKRLHLVIRFVRVVKVVPR